MATAIVPLVHGTPKTETKQCLDDSASKSDRSPESDSNAQLFSSEDEASPQHECAKPQRQRDLLVLVGPSGAGKSTLLTRLMQEYPSLFGYSVSHTTRDIRNGEVDGVNYHFIKPDEFRKLLDQGLFLEHAIVHDTMYGTSTIAIKSVLDQDRIVTMDLDIVGAHNVRKREEFRGMYLWVEAPNLEINETRLRDRGTETEDRIKRRMTSAVKELEWHRENGQAFFDLSLVNGDFEEAYAQFKETVLSLSFPDGIRPQAVERTEEQKAADPEFMRRK